MSNKTLFIGVANYKGGVAKTNTAINLARGFADESLHVIVLDDDDHNRTAKNWALRRGHNDPFTVLTMKQGQNYTGPRDVAIYDTPGGMVKSDIEDLVENTSYIVVPCKPDRESMDATEKLVRDLAQLNAKFKVLATDAAPAGDFARARQMLEYFAGEGIPCFAEIVPSSMKFKDASAVGKTIGEVSGGRLFADKFRRLANQILREVNLNLSAEEINSFAERIHSTRA